MGGHHVGFVAGVKPNGSIILLGGNQGPNGQGAVRYSAFQQQKIEKYVYPTGYTPDFSVSTFNILSPTTLAPAP